MLAFSLLNGFSQKLHYGLGPGLNYNTIVFTNLDVEFEQPKYKPGFQMNAVIRYNINDKLGLRFESGFSNRGAIIIFPGEPDSRINLNYISIPILFKYAPINRLSILAGPELINKPITINNWHTGGKFDERGFRCNLDHTVKTKTLNNDLYCSAHCTGQAVDFDVQDMTAEQVRQFIQQNQNRLPYNIKLEKGVSWVHLDVRNTGNKIYFF